MLPAYDTLNFTYTGDLLIEYVNFLYSLTIERLEFDSSSIVHVEHASQSHLTYRFD